MEDGPQFPKRALHRAAESAWGLASLSSSPKAHTRLSRGADSDLALPHPMSPSLAPAGPGPHSGGAGARTDLQVLMPHSPLG